MDAVPKKKHLTREDGERFPASGAESLNEEWALPVVRRIDQLQRQIPSEGEKPTARFLPIEVAESHLPKKMSH